MRWSTVEESADWPFVAKISPAGDRLVFASVYGAKRGSSRVKSMAVAPTGGVIALGEIPANGYSYEAIIAGIPVTPGSPTLPSAHTQLSDISYLFKLEPGKNPTTVRRPRDAGIAGDPVSIIANVLSPKLGGIVTFTEGATTLGTAEVVNGSATLVTFLAKGAHRITATYSLDGIESPPAFYVVNSQ